VTHGRARHLWLGGGAIAMGLGIWTMHFTEHALRELRADFANCPA
jgi:hypothetical protein